MDIKDDELLKLNPFRFNWSERYVACVGENGGTTNYDILEGFKEAVLIILNDIKSGRGIEDELVYPLVYAIRHCVELSLKISINLIRDICDIKSVDFGIDNKLNTHNIEELSLVINQLYRIDRRIFGLFDVALKYTKDFEFDKQSDIFRYECNLEGKELLKELHISHICIEILEKKFLRMYELLDYAIHSLSYIKNEYSVKTFTKKLSRNDIEQISKELMPITRWTEQAFNENRDEIRKKYGLSSNELSKAIDIVKINPFFANNIELFISIGTISDEELMLYADLISELTEPNLLEMKERRAGDRVEELLEELPRQTAKRDAIAANLSNDALFSLAAFGDMFETRDFYCENYQKHYDYFKNDENICRDWLIEKIATYIYALKVLKGMEWCGQSRYMTILKPLIDKIADDNKIPLRLEQILNIL